MNKGVFLSIFLLLAVFISCKKDKTVFNETSDQRLNQALAAYQDSLVNAPYGWRGYIFPGALNGGVIGFYFSFNNSNRVQMFSDFDSLSNVTVLESSYRLKALQQPSLIFDTYSYVSVLSDPDASVNGGSYGNGLGSDFQFSIDSVTADTIRLTGNLHSTKAYLVKASMQDSLSYYQQNYKSRLFDNLSKYITYFKRVSIGGTTYEVLADPTSRKVTITWIDSTGKVHTITTGYYYTATGVSFTTPVVNGSNIITGFDNITWNPVNSTMTLSVNGVTTTVNGAGLPLVPDVGSPARWYQYPTAQAQGGKWISFKGFHANGADDALGITTTTNFYFLSYEPGYGVSGTTPYDITGYYKVVNNALTIDYAPAFNVPSNTGDGRLKFSYLGYLGTFPSADSIPVTRTWMQFMEPNGYYFVQIDSTIYDMVSAKDARTWIRWVYN
jgi:hypothetical protein